MCLSTLVYVNVHAVGDVKVYFDIVDKEFWKVWNMLKAGQMLNKVWCVKTYWFLHIYMVGFRHVAEFVSGIP